MKAGRNLSACRTAIACLQRLSILIISIAQVAVAGQTNLDTMPNNLKTDLANDTANLAAPTATDSTDSAIELWQDQSVQDVLEQDIRQALRAAQEKNSVATGAPQSILAPRLVALYGVGKALMAEVQVGQQAYLYVRGQAYPAGYLGDPRVYQLKAMNGACVQLEKGTDKHSLCLRMLLGESLL